MVLAAVDDVVEPLGTETDADVVVEGRECDAGVDVDVVGEPDDVVAGAVDFDVVVVARGLVVEGSGRVVVVVRTVGVSIPDPTLGIVAGDCTVAGRTSR